MFWKNCEIIYLVVETFLQQNSLFQWITIKVISVNEPLSVRKTLDYFLYNFSKKN